MRHVPLAHVIRSDGKGKKGNNHSTRAAAVLVLIFLFYWSIRGRGGGLLSVCLVSQSIGNMFPSLRGTWFLLSINRRAPSLLHARSSPRVFQVSVRAYTRSCLVIDIACFIAETIETKILGFVVQRLCVTVRCSALQFTQHEWGMNWRDDACPLLHVRAYVILQLHAMGKTRKRSPACRSPRNKIRIMHLPSQPA